jgi:hypothetical protein
MSKLRTIPYAVLTASLFAAGGASAQSMYGIDQRQDYQQDRIERGIRDGQITRSEAYRLEQGERSIDRTQARARADGVVTPQERARIDRMTDRESREINQQSHDRQQSWDRGQSWGHTDGRYDGWRDNGRRQDGWGGRDGSGQNRGWDRDHDGDRGQHNGWSRGEHNGWDGNRPPGIERRDARDDQRIHNGMRDGSLTRGEADRLDRGQNRIDRYEARARSDGTVTPSEHNRIDNMQNRESRQIYADRHNNRTAPTTTPTTGTQPNPGSHSWGNGGWRQPQAGNTMPTRPTTATTTTARNGGNGRDPSYGQQTANIQAGRNAWANGGTHGQAQARTQPQPQPQPQAPTIRQAAFNPGNPARTTPVAATPTRTMSNGSGRR